MKDFVSVIFEGQEYLGTFSHWFNCGLSGDRIGVVNCDDGVQRAFPINLIQEDTSWHPHNLGCNCLGCL